MSTCKNKFLNLMKIYRSFSSVFPTIIRMIALCSLLLLVLIPNIHAGSELNISNLTKEAFERRATPVTEIQFPKNTFDYKSDVIRGSGMSIFFIVHVINQAIEKSYMIHGLFCEINDATTIYDMTFLGFKEGAKKFYDDNYRFYVADSENLYFTRCQPPGYSTAFTVDFLDVSGKKKIKSPDRAIIHMAAWLELFGSYRKNSNKANDFLKVILEKQSLVLKETEEKKDFRFLKLQLDLFDNNFPISVIEQDMASFSSNAKAMLRYYENALRLRRKLSILYPEGPNNIKAYEEIIKNVKHTIQNK